MYQFEFFRVFLLLIRRLEISNGYTTKSNIAPIHRTLPRYLLERLVEGEALEWAEATIGDCADEPR